MIVILRPQNGNVRDVVLQGETIPKLLASFAESVEKVFAVHVYVNWKRIDPSEENREIRLNPSDCIFLSHDVGGDWLRGMSWRVE